MGSEGLRLIIQGLRRSNTQSGPELGLKQRSNAKNQYSFPDTKALNQEKHQEFWVNQKGNIGRRQ